MLLLLVLLTIAGASHAESDPATDAVARTLYTAMEDSFRREYEAVLKAAGGGVIGSPTEKPGTAQHMLKLISYNRAVLFAFCAADAERAHTPNVSHVPAEKNLVLNTCLETKLAELDDFTNKLGYARVFFPDRIARCGEIARLSGREKLMPPYQFLQLGGPRLYDFPRYSECLMTAGAG